MAQNFVLPAQYQGMTLDQLAQTWQQPNTDQVPMPPMQMQAPVAGPEMPSRVPAEVPFAPQPPQSRGITSDDLMNGYGRPKQEMIPDLRGQLMEALNRQKASSEDSANLFKNYLSGNQRMDNSALVSLLDRAGGNKTPTPYLKPANYDEYAMGLSKLQNTANDNQKGVLDSLVKMAGQKTQDKYMDNLLRQQGREQGIFKDIVKDATNNINKLQSDFTQKNRQFDRLQEIFKKGNVVEIKNSLSNFARAVGDEKGPLNEGDVNRAFFQDLAARFDSLSANLDPNQKYSPEQLAASLNLIGYAKSALNDVYTDSVGNLQNNYGYRAQAMGQGDKIQPGQPLHNMFESAKKVAKKVPSLPGAAAAAPQAQAAAAPSAAAPKTPRKLELNGKILTEGIDF